ncbi:thiol-disulfide oxidoreductase DCC family protein [Algoriphagus boritolerans]|uniref:Predicted thiol-disulfide oxidoreductase YuxK, DCC family n=1 Tax=Algoriphagus boritolerans DSM 17298 = JCM 18970 TaxID=1120964 RepID=A0A1H6A0X8_9BACT|nr:thiol-disulfide oxidoreductase DCC family protein [Algoriphagus boritolerans]SEG41894.1 Predicted thiol-disulfide oxidoreductase YuxK, DCC family [Algoriphagus boritolerans DSM 17298 = JCM 18970]
MISGKSVILFDGVCNLCNASIDFIIKRDKKNRFLVGALQEEAGKKLLSRFEVNSEYLDSLVLIEDGQVYFRSTAALKIAKNLPGLWPLFYLLIFLPSSLRDGIYDWIGKNRYRWFGKKNTCRLPSPEEKAKFL